MGQEGVIPFNLKFLKLDQSDLRNFKFKKGQEGGIPFNLKFLKLDQSDLRNFKFKKGQEGVVFLNLKSLKSNQSDLRNFKFKKGKEGNTFQLEISETRPVGFKKFQIQEGARGSSIFEFFEFEIS